MPYKISGSKSETARIIILKESDWSIEINTVISGSGAYEILDLESGNKTIVADADGEVLAYGNVATVSYIPATGDRALFAGGTDDGTNGINTIEYVSISTPGDASNFGDLTQARWYLGACSNGTTGRGVFGGGYTSYPSTSNTLDYVTVLTTGDASDFGDFTVTKPQISATSNRTNDRGVFGSGVSSAALEYITISSTGAAASFGNLTIARCATASCSNSENERGLWGGGESKTNVIDFITINSAGDATNFGDLYQARSRLAAVSNGTSERGVFGGGAIPSFVNTIDYVTINSLGNATLFGELTSARNILSGTSNDTANRGIFGGGGDSNIIDYITINSTSNASNFGDISGTIDALTATSNG